MKPNAMAIGTACLAAATISCTQPAPENRESEGVFSEHRSAETPARLRGTLSIGADCQRYGQDVCDLGVCLHYRDGDESRYGCSKRCESASECPSGWSCLVVDAQGTTLCMPRSGSIGSELSAPR